MLRGIKVGVGRLALPIWLYGERDQYPSWATFKNWGQSSCFAQDQHKEASAAALETPLSVMHNTEGNKEHYVTTHCSNPHCCRNTAKARKTSSSSFVLWRADLHTSAAWPCKPCKAEQILFQVVPEDHSSKGHCPR